MALFICISAKQYDVLVRKPVVSVFGVERNYNFTIVGSKYLDALNCTSRTMATALQYTIMFENCIIDSNSHNSTNDSFGDVCNLSLILFEPSDTDD